MRVPSQGTDSEGRAPLMEPLAAIDPGAALPSLFLHKSHMSLQWVPAGARAIMLD